MAASAAPVCALCAAGNAAIRADGRLGTVAARIALRLDAGSPLDRRDDADGPGVVCRLCAVVWRTAALILLPSGNSAAGAATADTDEFAGTRSLRIAAGSQLARFINNPTALDDDTLQQLANGRRPGKAALQQLASLPAVQADGELSRRIEVALHPERWRPTVYDPQRIIGRIPVVVNGFQPDAELWRALAETYKDELAVCVRGGSPSPCLLLAQDVTRDGQQEWIFIQVKRFRVGVFGRNKTGHWQQIGSNYYLSNAPDVRQLHAIIARGAVSAVPKPLDDLMLCDGCAG